MKTKIKTVVFQSIRFALVMVLMPGMQTIVFGQTETGSSRIYKNHISLEIGALTGIGSLNYERMVWGNESNKMLGRIGFSYLPYTVDDEQATGTFILPFGVYYLLGKKHHLETGLNFAVGVTINDIEDAKYFYRRFSPSISYRFENFQKRSMFCSIGLAPVLYDDEDEGLVFEPWIKLGIGYSF
jgi:hypothetical protein